MDFRRLCGHVASKVSGRLCCQAHLVLGAKNFGVGEAELADLRTYATSAHYSERARLALDAALAAPSHPDAVTDDQFAQLRQHWSNDEAIEFLGVAPMFAFLNSWNDTLGTTLEASPSAVAEKALRAQGRTDGKRAMP